MDCVECLGHLGCFDRSASRLTLSFFSRLNMSTSSNSEHLGASVQATLTDTMALRIGRIQARMAAACARVGRDPAAVALLPVSKTFDSKAIREALAGRAASDGDGRISALAVGEYVMRRVPGLAAEKQHRQDAVFRTAQRDLRSFPLARVAR